MTSSEFYPTKQVRYKICEFILLIRKRENGLGSPIRINLNELFNFVRKGNDEDEEMEIFREELISLSSEKFGEAMNRPVIEIPEDSDISIIKDIKNSLKRNLVITVVCTSENIEDYMKELRKRTDVAMRELGFVKLEPISDGGVKIILGDKEMKVTKTRGKYINLRSSMVSLMYGDTIVLNGYPVSLDDYERKDYVVMNDLMECLRRIEEANDERESRINSRSIKDAITGLNKRSREIFGHYLFEINQYGLRWVL